MMSMIHGDLQTARAHLFKALGDKTRLSILTMLGKGQLLSVTGIYQKLGHAQNLISHHLTCLKNCGLIASEKQGKQVFYKLRDKRLLKLFHLCDRHIRDVLESILLCDVVSEEKATITRSKKLKQHNRNR